MTTDRYGNLQAVSSGLQTQGSILQFAGAGVAALSVVGGYFWGLPFGAALVALGIVLGMGMYVSGTFIAAAGEAMLALADIAMNTRKL
jgi:hypothetical protein